MFVASGVPTPTLSETGALPTGLTFTNNGNGTATLSGTLATGTAGAYKITVTAHNGVGTDASQTFTLTVDQPPSITSAANATFSVGTQGSFNVIAAGFPTPTLSESGTLPAGVTFNPASNILSGTPKASGNFNLTFAAHNGVGADFMQNFTLNVTVAPAITSPSSTTVVSFAVGTAGTFPVTSTGVPTPTLTEIDPLPAGITFVDNGDGTGKLAGIASINTVGTCPVSVKAHNNIGSDAVQSFTLVINKGAPAITWTTPAAITYGTALSGIQLNATASVPGSFAYSPASGTVLAAGSQTLSVTFTPTDTTNYTTANGNVSLTVNKAVPVITWGTPAAITHGTVLSGTQLDATANIPGTFVYAPAAGTILTAGSQTLSVTLTPADTTNYTTASGNVTLAVIKAAPVITWATPAPITFGTVLSGAQLNATASVPGSFVYAPAAGTVLAAGNQSLSVTFTPTDTVNYTATNANVTLAVNKATPVIFWATPAAITYGTALSATQLDATANIPGTFVYAPAAGAILAAGIQSLSVTFSPTDAANYTAANGNVTLTVNKATPVISWTPAPITFGTPLSGTQLNATASVPGSFSYAPAAGTVLTAGSQSLSATFTPSDTANYTTASANVTLAVNKAAPVITWATPAAITYGTALSATQLDATANIPGTFVYSPATGTILPAGNQSLSATFTPTDTANYAAATGNVTLAVSKAAPVISWATPAAITYGTALSATQLDATANIPGTLVYAPAAGAILAAGIQSLSVTFSPTDAANYTAANGNVTLTVNKATPVISWTPAPITFGTPLSGTQLNATASVPGSFSYAPAAGTVLTAGSQSLSATFTPTDTANYTTASANVTLAVNKAAPVITWATPAAITYGTALSGTQLNATASVPGTFAYNPATGTILAAGSQLLSATFAPTDTANYAAATGNVTLAVNKATPVISWAMPAAITYGTALSATQLNATANIPGTFVYAPAAGTILAAGSQSLSVTFTPTDTTNYTTATGNATITVNKASAGVTLGNLTQTYDGTPKTASATTSPPALNVAFSYSGTGGTNYGPSATAPTTVGTYTATGTINDANYTGSGSATLAINKATPVISWATPAGITYGTALSGTQLNAAANIPGTFVYAPVAGTILAAGTQSLSVTFTPIDAANYTTASANTTITVSKASAAVTLGNLTQTYDGTPKTASATTTPTGLNVTWSYLGTGGTVYGPSVAAPSSAGTYTVTATINDASFSGSGSSALTINKATPVIAWAPPAAVNHGVALSATQLNATATVAGSFVYSPAAGAVLNVGSQTLSVTFTPADTTDYTTATRTVNFVVNPAPLVSIAVSPANTSIAKGLTQQFTAIGTYSDSSTQNLTSSSTWSSSSPAVATISATGLAQSLAIGSTTIQATSGGMTSSATTFTVTAATLASIVVTPANLSIANGLTQQFTAIGTYSDSSTKNLTSSVTWVSSVEATATISPAGLATALSTDVPITEISAISGSILGSTNLTVTPATLVSVAVTPPNPSIAKGSTQQFTAIGTYTDNTTQNLTNTATWSSSAAAVATIGATGLTQSLATGSTTIRAVSGSVTSNLVTLIVSPPALVSIAMTPTSSSIAKGTTQQFTAIGTYTDNSTQNLTSTVTWNTSTPAVATIGATGLAQSLATGSTTIQAVSGSVSSNSATLTVSPAILQSISVTPANPSIAKGTTMQFIAIGTYTDSTQDLTNIVTWSSSAPAVATINGTGVAQSLITGSTTIQAATSGLTSSPITLTVTAATLASLAVTPNAASVIAGNTVQFTALGTYSDGTVQDQTSAVTWASADISTATINTAGLATGVRAGGPVSITAAQGGVVSGAAGLTVNSSPTISTQPANQTATEGQTATFMVAVIGTAPFTYQWQRNGVIIPGATSSSYTTLPTTAADSGASFAVVVTNSLGNATSNASTLTVNLPPSITSQPSSQTVNAGQPATFTVVATGTPPLTYQWRKNGVNIPGATSSSYTTPAATASDNGATFDVLVTNVVDTKTSILVTLTVNAPPSITGPPASQTVGLGQTATFMVAVTGGTPFTFQWQANGTTIPGATSSSYTTPATVLTDNGTVFTVTASNAAGSALSGPALLTVHPTQPVDVVTYHNDAARTGQNSNETILSPANVNSTAFGKIAFSPLDGRVDAQPLYLSSVAIPGQGMHDVVYVATENDGVYALDSTTGQKLWQVSVVGAGETPSDDRGCTQVSPTIGITSTPVIDRASGPNGAIYLVAMSKDAGGNYFQRIHALDITTGAELFGGPTTIQASVPGTGDNTNGQNVIFNPSQYKERAGLLLVNGVVYTTWASHCDATPYTGWIMGFNQTTLAMTTVLNITPNGSGGGIWMSGAAPAADSSGNVYLAAGNGAFDATLDAGGFPSLGDYGNALLKLSTSSGLGVADYFKSATGGNGNTVDLSSGGTLLLPDLQDGTGHVWRLALAAGKDANLYVIDRDAMGKFNPAANTIHQEIDGLFPGGNYSAPAYFNNTVYYGPAGQSIQAFGINNALLSTTPSSQTAATFLYPGATPSISSNGPANAILWAVENNSTAAVLHAYDATNLAIELYNSNQAAGSRDQFGPGNKFITPTIANGRVYVGTTNGLAIFGLLSSGPANSAPSITTQPTNEIVYPGQTATFVVGATGSAPLSFQWRKNGSNISGATFSSYTIPPATVADNVNNFSVVVTNWLGSAVSVPAFLYVVTPPTIVTQPANQTVVVGEEATFSVRASASDVSRLSYKWQLNGMDIPGASSSSYTTPVVALTDNGEQFSVVVSDALGQAISISAGLTVLPHPSPTTYYIDTLSGSNQNNGIFKNSPLQNAPGMNGCSGNCSLIQLGPGDRVIFKGGDTWNELAFPFIINASGSPGNPIYFGLDATWFNGATWSRPVFDLSGAIWTFAPVLASQVHDVIFDGFEIRNELIDSSNDWPPRASISVDGGANVAIQNVYIHSWAIQNPQPSSDQFPFGGIAFYAGSTGGSVTNSTLDGGIGNDSGTAIYGGALIQGNIVKNVPHGILVFDSGADVSGNQVFNINSSANPNARANAIIVSGSANVYNNIVHDVAPAGYAIYLQSASHDSGNTQNVYNNLVWNTGGNAPLVINSQEMLFESTSNQFIYNNTFSGGAPAGCITVQTQFLPPTNLSVQNNHCISDQSSSQAWCWNNAGGNFQCGLVTNVVFRNNILMTTAASASQGYAIGDSFQPSSINATTVGAGLNLSTSCASVGSSLCSDRLGAARPAPASPWDAGAYIFQTSATIAPSITVQPLSLAVTAGQTATFTVIAAGAAPLNYQWQKNGSNIAGAQSSTYITAAATAADNGAAYTVVVSNAAGSVTSSLAVLSVNLAAGQLLANTSSLDFGPVVIGTSATQSLAVTNTSNSFVTISNVNVSGAAFSMTGPYPGLVLSPGQTVSAAVSFTAQVTGSVPGSIEIDSDAGNSPTIISLSGFGTTPPHSAILSWDPSASPVFGYYVYRAVSPFGPYVRLNPSPIAITQFTDVGILSGQSYIYVVTSVSPNTVESSFSDPVAAVIP